MAICRIVASRSTLYLTVGCLLVSGSRVCAQDRVLDEVWSAWTARQNRTRSASVQWTVRRVNETAPRDSENRVRTQNRSLDLDRFGTKLETITKGTEIRLRREVRLNSTKQFLLYQSKLHDALGESGISVVVSPREFKLWEITESCSVLQHFLRPIEYVEKSAYESTDSAESDNNIEVVLKRATTLARQTRCATTLFLDPRRDYLPTKRVDVIKDNLGKTAATRSTVFNYRETESEIVPKSWIMTIDSPRILNATRVKLHCIVQSCVISTEPYEKLRLAIPEEIPIHWGGKIQTSELPLEVYVEESGNGLLTTNEADEAE